MDIDSKITESLGFPRPKYTAIERERRWLCAAAPERTVIQVLDVVDVYVTGTRLRLREARALDGREEEEMQTDTNLVVSLDAAGTGRIATVKATLMPDSLVDVLETTKAL